MITAAKKADVLSSPPIQASEAKKTLPRIGFDCHAAHSVKSGLGVYTDNLFRALERETQGIFEFLPLTQTASWYWNTLRRLWWENKELPQLAKRQRVDILHVPAFAAPIPKAFRLVLTVHDIIGRLIPNSSGLASRFYWNYWLPESTRRADVIIADSESTKRDLIQHMKIKDSKIKVIYPSGHEGFSNLRGSAEFAALKTKLQISGPFFLCVGTIEPRKNLSRVLQAFARFIETKAGAEKLMIVGSQDFAHGKIFQQLLRGVPDASRVGFTGYIPQRELNLLYSHATALLFPSLYEGFGIPVLEAMAAGCPVVTSTTSSLPEVAGDAAILVDPMNGDAISEAMQRLSQNTDLGAELVQNGFRNIQRFSWKKTAQETMRIYQSLL